MPHSQTERLENCLGLVYANRHPIAERFYELLFEAMPEAEAMFASGFHKQKEMFSMMIAMLARSVSKGETLDEIAAQLNNSHARFEISRAQFSIGGDILVRAFVEILGDAVGACEKANLQEAIARLVDAMAPDEPLRSTG